MVNPVLDTLSAERFPATLDRARQGSREALGALLQSCRRWLLVRACCGLPRRLRSKGDAADLVQETFLHACQAFPFFQGKTVGEWLAWLRTILASVLRAFSRSWGTQRRLTRREVPSNALQYSKPVSPSDWIASSDRMIRDESAAVVRSQLAVLPAKYRRPLQLHFAKEQTFEAIGKRVGISSEAARHRVRRGLEVLRRRMLSRKGVLAASQE